MAIVIRDSRESAPDVRALIDALSEPAMIVAGDIVWMGNVAARALLGGDLEGRGVRDAFGHPGAIERILAMRPEAEEDIELIGIGDSNRRWRMSMSAFGDDMLLVRLSDRSEAHAAERMRVDFVANASHELRTPLATLVGYAETLLLEGDDIDRPTHQRFMTVVHDEALRMQRLVEDLISLSRIEAERFSAPTAALRLPELVEEAKRGIAGAARERGSDILLEAEPDLPPVAGDRSQLLQMIDNLLANALRYGRKGAPVLVSVERKRKMVRLVVSDEGEGIAPEHLPRITERFYRADPGRSRALGGTGLGLAIVKHIVERHRGRLTIKSTVGVGTSVRVLLPCVESQ